MTVVVTTRETKRTVEKYFRAPVGTQPKLLHRVLDRDEVPDVESDRVGKVLGGRV